MIIALALALFASASGTVASYLYDDHASFAARVCSGACVGIATLGLVGFVFASLMGLTWSAILLTAAVLTLPFALIDSKRKRALKADWSILSTQISQAIQGRNHAVLGYIFFYVAVSIVFWRVFNRAMIELPEGIFTGLLNNFGDLPFHISVITGFAFGNNFPPEDPTYAGVRFTYPFITDFVSAMFVHCGASLRQSMFIENFIVAISFVGVLHRWAFVMLRDRLAAIITPLLVLLNGGLGWVLIWQQARQNEAGLFGVLKDLPPSFTVIPDTAWRWGNAISALLVPQRGMLLGLPLAVIVFTQWWLAINRAEKVMDEAEKSELGKATHAQAEKELKAKRKRLKGKTKSLNAPFTRFFSVQSWHRMAAAGAIAGLLPLVHAHSFVVVMVMGGCLALLQRRWREWAIFLSIGTAIALPQMWWSTHHSAVAAKSFFEWQFGWDIPQKDPTLPQVIWFWFKNTGLFLPLTITAMLWRGREYLVPKRLLIFYLPFTLCFLVPNVLKMAPWIWDNIKVLFYWWLASAPLVALLLARLWRQGLAQRVLAVGLFLAVTLAGSLDVAGITLRSVRYEIFDSLGVRFSEVVKQRTEPHAVIIHAPVHNHPVFLTGRRSLMGYPGHIWTHGLEFTERESEIRKFFMGAPETNALISKYNIGYAVVGPHERNVMVVNDQFFSRFNQIGEVGGYRLYKVTQ